MKETESQTIIINFNLTHRTAVLLILAVLGAALLGYLAWGSRPVNAAGPQVPSAGSTGLRQYYLTTGTYNGSQALTACAAGYHMASLWEIMDTSNLQYNSTLGYSDRPDQGGGPPTLRAGWVHTGGASSSSTTPGIGNCLDWTSSSWADFGTYVQLDNNWTIIDNFQAGLAACNALSSTWCVED